MDLTEAPIPTSRALFSKQTGTDIKVSHDEGAVMNSLRNIFTTTPGEKILNPRFGINLTQWLFSPISEFNAQEIGEAIVTGIETFEPRLLVKTVRVNANHSRSEYEIQLVLTIPSLNIINKNYDAILNQPAFDFLTNTSTA